MQRWATILRRINVHIKEKRSFSRTTTVSILLEDWNNGKTWHETDTFQSTWTRSQRKCLLLFFVLFVSVIFWHLKKRKKIVLQEQCSLQQRFKLNWNTFKIFFLIIFMCRGQNIVDNPNVEQWLIWPRIPTSYWLQDSKAGLHQQGFIFKPDRIIV